MSGRFDFERIKEVHGCPIIEAVVEIRFSVNTEPEVVPHLIGRSKAIMERFGPAQHLPICELPASLRTVDPNLKYAPYQRREGLGAARGMVLQVGPRVLSLVVAKPYPGRQPFFDCTNSVLFSIQSAGVIEKVERLGVRYIDYFDFNILSKLKFNLQVGEYKLSEESLSCKVMLPAYKGFQRTLQLATGVSLNGATPVGSLFDVDAFTEEVPPEFLQESSELLKDGHLAQKEVFFSIIRQEFLEELQPVYGE